MKSTLAFALGFLLAAIIAMFSQRVEAQIAPIAFGSNSGTPVPIAVDASGNVKVQIN